MQKDRTLRYVAYFLYILTMAFFITYFKRISPSEISFTQWLQGASLQAIGLFFSYAFLIGLMALYFMLAYNLECYRPRFYYEAQITLNGLCIVCLLKLCFVQARPYQITLDVIALDCECDYGMPSGHAFAAAVMAVLYYNRVNEWIYTSR
jgi:membrane-associated phospholipid phosphatase